MRRSTKNIRVAGIVLAMALGAVAVAAPLKKYYAADPVSDVIFPPQQVPLRFNHSFHITEAGAECLDCHGGAATSVSSADSLIPKEETCSDCHAIDREQPNQPVEKGVPPANCASCHVGFKPGQPVARVVIPPPNLDFNHKVHVSKKIACETCHGDLAKEKVGLATKAQLPKMGLCLQCHEGRKAPDACTTCHKQGVGGKVRTKYETGVLKPSGSIRGATHNDAFRTNHKYVAQNDPKFCDSCHQKQFCVSCHNGVQKPLDFHGNDYVNMHQMDARRNAPNCSSCHRSQTFCIGCHSRSGVSPDGKGTEFGPLLEPKTQAFHPTGWVEYSPNLNIGPRGPNHHSFQAQRNIKQCAPCHQESFCTNCHTAQSGPFNVNPHPAGWASSRRCKNLRAKAGRMCLKCHVDPSEAVCN